MRASGFVGLSLVVFACGGLSVKEGARGDDAETAGSVNPPPAGAGGNVVVPPVAGSNSGAATSIAGTSSAGATSSGGTTVIAPADAGVPTCQSSVPRKPECSGIKNAAARFAC